ncbi:MAG: mannose-1-phosphate guanylyltransferase [Cyanobacteriota bacterium]|nr:mannose-1-phosphate guanylyltransferase [Cyanobacteriota bacterium]
MSQSFVPVVLAGGKGERFWPLSRKQRPKQFLSLDGSGLSLLQSTAERLHPMAGGPEQLWIVTASHLAPGIQEQLPQLPTANLLVEPEGRDTAPAVAWTTLEVAKRYGEDAVVGFFPADHWIADRDEFDRTLQAAVELANAREAIVTLGVKPGYAATGYGYIEQGEAIGQYGSLDAYRVDRFTEKPDAATAEEFLATGRFSWNSGIFVFRAGVALAELRTHAPQLMEMLEARGVEAYPELPKTSIDYALMEKTELACVLPVSFGWDDLGDWNAIERLLKGDKPNLELANHVGQDTEGAILYASNDREVIVTIGLEDILVVRDGDVTLVVKKDRTQDIKQIVKAVRDNPKYAHLL